MGKSFKLKTFNYKSVKDKVIDHNIPLRSPYVKDKSTTIYPVYFNFLEQWEPDKFSNTVEITLPSSLWDGPIVTNNYYYKYDDKIFHDKGRCCTPHNKCICDNPI